MKTPQRSAFRNRQPLLRPLALALAATTLLSFSLSLGAQTPSQLPTGLQVVRGQAQAQTEAGRMTVHNSAGAILNWNSFSIGSNNQVHFQQPDAASKVLNRVLGKDPSQIFGQLSSNGQVWLLNPNGVLFGAGSRVDVAGLVASTLHLNDSDWLAGRTLLGTADALPAAAVVNEGEIKTLAGGRVALVAAEVRNEGRIDTPQGQTVLAGARQVELIDTATPHVRVRLNLEAGEVVNTGLLQAEGGRIDIHAGAVRQQGQVRADGAQGGAVELNAGSGRLTVSGEVSALGHAQQGGQLLLLGREVAVVDQAGLDASGRLGGGEILIGGGEQGRDARFVNSQGLFFGATATARADALVQGDGGRVILWSDQATRAFGSFSAQGAGQGGAGGFVETSGGWLDARPSLIQVGAPLGAAGTWLLDPYNITINDDPSHTAVQTTAGAGSSLLTPTASGSIVSTSVLDTALSAGLNVTISTAGAGAEVGDINWFGNLSPGGSPMGTPSLTLIADRNINMSGSISFGYLGISMQAGRSAAGSIHLSGSNINVGGGGVSLTGFGGSAALGHSGRDGVRIESSAINTAGPLVIKGQNPGGLDGVVFTTASTANAQSIDIQGAATGASSRGITIDGSTLRADRGLKLVGQGTAAGVYIGNTSEVFSDVDGYDGSVQMQIIGTGLGASGKGVVVVGSISNPTLRATDTGVVLISGSTASASNDSIDFTGSSAALLSAAATGQVNIQGAVGPIWLGSATMSLSSGADDPQSFTVNGPQIYWSDSQLTSAGSVYLRADSHVFSGANSRIGGAGAGLVGAAVTGQDGVNGANRIDNQTGAALFGPNPTQWTLVGISPLDSATYTPGQNQFNRGGLVYSYKAYGQVFDEAFISNKGNGLLFTSTVLATLGGTVFDKVYDGNTSASSQGLTVTGLPGDTLYVNGGLSVSFLDKHAGANKPVQIDNPFAITAADSAERPIYGYSVPASPYSASITPAPLAVSGLVALDKVYDGTVVATLSGTLNFNALPGDSVTLAPNAFGYFQDRHVGANKPVTLSSQVLGGPDGGNYTPVFNGSLSASITPAPLLVGGLAVLPKVYDGTTLATVSGLGSLAVFAGDVVGVAGSPSASYDTRHVGTQKPVTVTGLSLSGPDAGNYSVSSSLLLAGDITPAPLTVSGLSVQDRVYDGSTQATLLGSVSVVPLGGDVVSLRGTPTAVFESRHAGVDKPVVLSGLSLTGVDAGNYLVQLDKPLTGTITPATLEIGGLTAANKTYDATTAATLSGTPSFTLLGGDQVSVDPALKGSFDTKHVGLGKTVTLQGLTLLGPDAGNYVPVAVGTLKADISPLQTQFSGLQALSKVYDGTTLATFSGSPSFAVLGGDQVTLNGSATGQFDTKQVGTGKTVTLGGLSFGGADAGNYVFTFAGTLKADITPLTLPLAGLQVLGKTYDGSTTAPLSGTASITPVAGDQVTVAGAAQAVFTGANAAGVGAGKPVSLSGLSLAGADAGNYLLTLPALSGSVQPANLQYVADPVARLIGQPTGPLTGTVTGFVGGESMASATSGALAFTTSVVAGPTQPLPAVGSFAIVGSGLSAANYVFAQAPGNASALVVYQLTPEIVAQNPQTIPTVPSATGGSGGNSPAPSGPPTLPPLAGNLPDTGGGAPVVAGTLDLSGGAPAPAPQFVPPTAPAAPPAAAPGPTPSAAPSAAPATPATGASTSGGSSASAGAGSLGGTGAASGTAPAAFAAVNLSSMPLEAIQSLIDDRNRVKQRVFAESIERLRANPALADLQPCTTRLEAEAGNCLVTESLRQEIQKAEQTSKPAAPVGGPVAPRTSASPAAAPTTAAPAPVRPLFADRRGVRTAALPQIERKVALIIGVNDYQDPRIPKLENAVNDAVVMASLAESELGYETVLIRDATRAQVVAALNRLSLELRPQDSVLVYYAGHGDEVASGEGAAKHGYWQLADSDAKRPETWLSNNDIGRLLGSIPASQVALLSDSCYSGTLVSGPKVRAVPGPLDPAAMLSQRTVVVMSSGGNAPVADAGQDGHSPFAHSLFRTLRQVSAWKPGANVFETVRFLVANKFPQTPQYGLSSAATGSRATDYLFEQRKLNAR